MSRTRAIVSIAASILLACTLVARAARADGRSEAAAKDALQKAQSDFLAMNYAGAAARLNKAVQACGAKNCTPLTKATLLRDLGTMQFRGGDKNAAAKSWADALTLQPTLGVSPDYDASDVGAAWEDARAVAGLPAGPVSTKPPPSAAGTSAPAGVVGTAGAAGSTGARASGRGAAGAAPPPPPEPMGEQPTGDFVHDPAPEQKEDTPLPIHVEYTGSSTLARVVVKYKGAQMREWTRVELKRVGEAAGSPAWEGTIPCADIGRGTLRYWVQGFDRAGEPLAATGDPKHPYYVPIRDKITSEPPHLPGKEAPKSCEESDCPPGLPGCKGGKKGSESTSNEGATSAGASEGGGGGAAGEEAGSEEKKPEGPYRRMWFGVSLDIDFLSLSTVGDVCRRNPNNGTALNSAGYYCYDPVGGADFPIRDVNLTLKQGGTTSGGFQLGNVRAMLAFEYAWNANLLIGGRLGYVFNAYPGSFAPHFPPLHIEVRATYLLGRAPMSPGKFAPLGFAALGLSEFDGHQSTCVTFTGAPPSNTCPPAPLGKVVDVWAINAPFFIALGAGARYQFGPRVATTAALRLNLVIGGNGLLPTFGPEIGALYAF